VSIFYSLGSNGADLGEHWCLVPSIGGSEPLCWHSWWWFDRENIL